MLAQATIRTPRPRRLNRRLRVAVLPFAVSCSAKLAAWDWSSAMVGVSRGEFLGEVRKRRALSPSWRRRS